MRSTNDLNSILLEGEVTSVFSFSDFNFQFVDHGEKHEINVQFPNDKLLKGVEAGARLRVVGKLKTDSEGVFIVPEHIEVRPKTDKQKKIAVLQNITDIYTLLCELETGEYDDIENLASYLPSWGALPDNDVYERSNVYSFNRQHLLVADDNGNWNLERRVK